MYITASSKCGGRRVQGCNNPSVSYNRRPQRQGVRYGPPRERARQSENGVIIGRLLGMAVLLLTLGILAAGALSFIDDRPGQVGATSRTTSEAVATAPGPTESPRPGSPSMAPSMGPIPTPTTAAIPSAVPSSLPSAAPPSVQVGAGYVTFGTRADRQLRIVDPAATFPLGERVIWSAFLTQPANSTDLHVQVFKVDGTPPTGERLVLDEAVTPVAVESQIFQRRIRPSEALDGPGIYVVRYVRGAEILSEGSMEITT
jgi:hypothetical protein